MAETQVFPCKPSQVAGKHRRLPIPACTVPLVATLGKLEREVVAAIVVEYCRDNGDTWQPVPANAFGRILDKYQESNPFVMTMNQDIINAMWAMGGEGLLIIDQTTSPQTLAATPKLAELIK